MQVRGQVPVAEVEPRRLAEASDPVERVERLAAKAPSAALVEEPAKRVADGVQVGGDVKSPDHRVVTGVADHEELPRRDEAREPPQELRRSGPAGEGDEGHARGGEVTRAGLAQCRKTSAWRPGGGSI